MTSGTELSAASTPAPQAPAPKNPVKSWEFVVLNLLLLLLVLVAVQKPTGSIAGSIAREQRGFNLYSYDFRANNVYVLAIGPRGTNPEERGAWVRDDGTFRIDKLPVGEYQLKVRVPGFATTWESGVFVHDGKVTALKYPLLLNVQEPHINAGSARRVFGTNEKPRFWINSSGCENAVVKVYNQSMIDLIQDGSHRGNLGLEINSSLHVWRPWGSKAKGLPFENGTPIRTWERRLGQTGDSDWARQDFQFDEPLPVGDYFVVVEGANARQQKDWAIMWFSVSDLGLIVKQDSQKTVVRALNLTTLKPEPGAKIDLIDRARSNFNTVATATTGADGFASIALPAAMQGASSLQLLAYGTRGVSHAYGGVSFYGSRSNRYDTYFYTDRPIYRLGQTVFFKAIARHNTPDGFRNPGSINVQCTIEDPENNVIKTTTLRTSRHGTLHGVFDVPVDGKTGGYQISFTYPDGSVDYERVEVGQYRKPEYQVDIYPLEENLIAGTKAKARIKARYYFGAPVANAKVHYQVFQSPDYEFALKLMDRPEYADYFDGWDDGYSDGYYSSEYVTEGEAVTDANGEAVIEFDTASTGFDANDPTTFGVQAQRYKIEATVTDISRIAVESSAKLQAVSGNFALFVTPDSYVAKVGENVSVGFQAVFYDGQPAANQPVTLQLMRRHYDKHNSGDSRFIVESQVQSVTDSEGKGRVTFGVKPEYRTDLYWVAARSRDRDNRTITASQSIWVYDANDRWAISTDRARQEPLSIKLDKAVYQPGDVARVMITAPIAGKEDATQAIVAIEGSKLYSYSLVDLDSAARLIEVPITESYAPNVYITATFIGKKRQFYNQSQIIKVSPHNRFLNVKIETDKPRYKPGEQITYTINATTLDGKPAADAELSLGVVDESIYAVRADSVPDIRKFFYRQRRNDVLTLCSFPEEYSGGPDKTEPRVRKDFKDTAAWFPTLITDSNGIATATFTLPDNLTTWRATVRGINGQTDVGWSLKKVISTQDLVLRLALPRFFTLGDESDLTAVVHNYTDRPQTIKLTLAPAPEFQVLKGLAQQVEVKPDGAARLSWPVRVVSSGEATVRVKAVGQTAADAMEMKLPVHPFGMPVTVTAGGYTADEEMTIMLPIPTTDAAPGSARYKLCLSSSALGPMLGNFSALIDYPYGCTEQTMSKLMPSIVAMRMHQALGVPLDRGAITRFQKVYEQGMAKLERHQHDDGGWGWWETDESNPYLTALVMEGWYRLREAGYHVDAERARRGKQWLVKNVAELNKQLLDPLLAAPGDGRRGSDAVSWSWRIGEASTDLARMVYTLSLYKEAPPAGVVKQALGRLNTLSPEALSYWTLALKSAGDEAVARKFYDRLLHLANTTDSEGGPMLDWVKSVQMEKKLGTASSWALDRYRFAASETTALALQAVVAMESSSRQRIEGIKRWLLMQRGKDGFGNTKATAQVFAAMMADELTYRPGNQTDYTVEITRGDQVVAAMSFDKESEFKPEQVLPVELADGAPSLVVRKKGGGRLYYTSVLNYYRALKPGTATASGEPKGLSVSRKFYRLQATTDSHGKTHFRTMPVTNGRVKAGETLLMKLLVDSPTRVPYLISEAAIPSGAEVVKRDSRQDMLEADEENRNEVRTFDPWYYWWTHQDILDEKMAFFVTTLEPGKYEFHTMLRMELPGKYRLNPVTLEGMYTKSIHGYSNPDYIEVVE